MNGLFFMGVGQPPIRRSRSDLDGHSRRHMAVMAVAVAMDIDDRYFHIQARRFINLDKPTVNGFIWIYDDCE